MVQAQFVERLGDAGPQRGQRLRAVGARQHPLTTIMLSTASSVTPRKLRLMKSGKRVPRLRHSVMRESRLARMTSNAAPATKKPKCRSTAGRPEADVHRQQHASRISSGQGLRRRSTISAVGQVASQTAARMKNTERHVVRRDAVVEGLREPVLQPEAQVDEPLPEPDLTGEVLHAQQLPADDDPHASPTAGPVGHRPGHDPPREPQRHPQRQQRRDAHVRHPIDPVRGGDGIRHGDDHQQQDAQRDRGLHQPPGAALLRRLLLLAARRRPGSAPPARDWPSVERVVMRAPHGGAARRALRRVERLGEEITAPDEVPSAHRRRAAYSTPLRRPRAPRTTPRRSAPPPPARPAA